MAVLKFNGIELEIKYLSKLEDILSNVVWYQIAISMNLNGRKIINDYQLKIKENNEYWNNRDFFKVQDNDNINGKKISMPYFIEEVIKEKLQSKKYNPMEPDFELKLMKIEENYKLDLEIDNYNLKDVEEYGTGSILLSMLSSEENLLKFSKDMIDEISILKAIEIEEEEEEEILF